MSQFIKFYITSSMLNMFRTLITPSSGDCSLSIISPHRLCVLVSMCVGVSVWLVDVVSMWQAEAAGSWWWMYKCPKHVERRRREIKLNHLTPNVPYNGPTAPLTSKRYILYIYSTNIGTENFKHGIYSPYLSLKNAVSFIILTYLVLVLFTFY